MNDTASVQWSKELETVHPIIDGQHKRLLTLLSELAIILENHRPSVMVERAFTEVMNYALLHFSTEEKIMEKARYSGLEQHKALHAELANKAQRIMQAYKSGGIVLTTTLSDFFSEWETKHIKESDMAAVEWLRTHRSES